MLDLLTRTDKQDFRTTKIGGIGSSHRGQIASGSPELKSSIPSKVAASLASDAKKIEVLSHRLVNALETKRTSILHLENANSELKAVVTLYEEQAFAGKATAMSNKQLNFLQNSAEIH